MKMKKTFNMKKTVIACSALCSAIAGLVAPSAHADLAATVGVSNMYYWRGFDLGGGAAVSVDVNESANGFVAGLWGSSGDGTLGTEYDIYGGYSGAVSDFTYGLSVVSYNYSDTKTGELKTAGPSIKPGDYVEVIPSIGYGPFKLTYYDAVEAKVAPLNNKDYSYATAELNFDSCAFKIGHHMTKDKSGLNGATYFDATYKYTEKVSFTLGKIVDEGSHPQPHDLHFVVNLTLPIK